VNAHSISGALVRQMIKVAFPDNLREMHFGDGSHDAVRRDGRGHSLSLRPALPADRGELQRRTTCVKVAPVSVSVNPA
jgi:hypothetical protein